MKKIVQYIRSRDFIFYSIFLLILICIRSSVFASYHVPTGSMNPLIPVFADRTNARRFSKALNTDIEKC